MKTSSSISPELVDALKRLKLGRVANTLPDRLVLADKQDMPFEDLLLMVLTDETALRDNAAADNRAAEAGLDPSMRLELWDKTSKVSFEKRVLSELVSLRFLETKRHVTILGPVGVGKTFIASALGHIACRHGYSTKFARADETLKRLRQSRFDNSRDAEMIALTTVDLLILDDFALEPMSKEESKDVYQLFLERTGFRAQRPTLMFPPCGKSGVNRSRREARRPPSRRCSQRRRSGPLRPCRCLPGTCASHCCSR